MALPSGLVGPVTISRYDASGYYDPDGFWVEAGFADVTVTGMIHRETGNKGAADESLENRDGGSFQDGFIRLYSNEQTYTDDKETGRQADRLTWMGHVYEIQDVQYMNQLSLSHYKSVAQRVDEKTNGA